MSVKPWDFFNPNTIYAEEQVVNQRYLVCKSCPEFISMTKQCKKCGCFMPAKTKMQAASCPLNKWAN